jgi:hypothetical protein
MASPDCPPLRFDQPGLTGDPAAKAARETIGGYERRGPANSNDPSPGTSSPIVRSRLIFTLRPGLASQRQNRSFS